MKKEIAIKLDEELLEMAKAEAKAQNRSFNNYIEHLLFVDLGSTPKQLAKKAIYDTQYDLNLTKVEGFDKWIESFLNGESDI